MKSISAWDFKFSYMLIDKRHALGIDAEGQGPHGAYKFISTVE
jgi:hypothetical protein